jgi:preprotein translocase subunit SecF
MIEIIKNTKLNFIGARKITYVISIILVLNGLWAVYKIASGQAKMGLDFTGGISVQVQFKKDVKVDDVRSALNNAKISGAVIQQIGTPEDKIFLIRVGTQDLKTGLVSSQLKETAFYAVFWALLGILVYIWIRFQFKFAVAATIATLHDVLAVLGILMLLNKEVDMLVITSLLTIAGYSLTDTVVVFDRIRENMKHILKVSYHDLVNVSINEVLSRTIITSFTTFSVALCLFLFGGNVLHTFSLAMVIGVVVGTYSSDFLASPIIVDWENFERKNRTGK